MTASRRIPRLRSVRLGAAVTTVAATAAALAVVLTAGPAAGLTTTQAVVNSAASYGSAHGYRVGVAVYDTQKHVYYGAGADSSTFASESVVKVMIATSILLQGRMQGSVAATAYKMITQSDDASANALYGLAGGDSVINRMKSKYGIPFLGTPPSRSGWWGNTHITPKGMVYLYAKLKGDGAVWPWLSNAMAHATRNGSDGTFQFFGIPSATTGFGVKQGWGDDTDCQCGADFNTTGFVNHQRYMIAMLAHGPAGTYGGPIGNTLTSMAQILMPGGALYNGAAHNPKLGVQTLSAHGSTLYVDGWAIDLDHHNTTLSIKVYNGSALLATGTTRYGYAPVNQLYKTGGTHGYRITTPSLGNGPHTICVVAVNIADGVDTRQCYPATINGSPRGALESVKAGTGSTVTVTGWAYDPDTSPGSNHVWISVDGTRTVLTWAEVDRPDLNTAYRFTGPHGFQVTLTGQSPGSHSYCAMSVNAGRANPDADLGCTTVTVPAVARAAVPPAGPSTGTTPSTPVITPTTPSTQTTPTTSAG